MIPDHILDVWYPEGYNRNAKIVMEVWYGMRYQDIADFYGIHLSRVGQIVKKYVERYGLTKDMEPYHVGCILAARKSVVHENSPEAFYYDVLLPNILGEQ